MQVKENSKVKIYDYSGRQYIGECKTEVDIEVVENSIIVIDGGLCCVETIKQVSDEEYEMGVWCQDALLVKDGVFHQSICED